MLYQQAKTFNQKPSDLIGDLTPWVAWMTDEAVLMAGTFIQNKLDERNEKYEPVWTFDQIIAGETSPPQEKIDAPNKESVVSRWKATFGRAMG